MIHLYHSLWTYDHIRLVRTKFLEAQLLYNWIDVTDSLTTSHLPLSTISQLFVDRFGRFAP